MGDFVCVKLGGFGAAYMGQIADTVLNPVRDGFLFVPEPTMEVDAVVVVVETGGGTQLAQTGPLSGYGS